MNIKEKVRKAMACSGFIMLNKEMTRIFGMEASVLLADLIGKDRYFEERNERYDDWFFNTRINIARDTGLSAYRQRAAEKQLLKQEIIKVNRKGIPAKNYYHIEYDKIDVKVFNTKSCDILTPTHQNTEQLYVQKRNGNNNKNKNKNNNKNDDQLNHHEEDVEEGSVVEDDRVKIDDELKDCRVHKLNIEQQCFLDEYRKCYQEYFNEGYTPTSQDIRKLEKIDNGTLQSLMPYLDFWFEWKNDMYRKEFIKDSDASLLFLLYQPVRDRFLNDYDENRIARRKEKYRLKME